MEIERRFLIKQLPEDLEQYPREHIEQAYLCTNPVIRVRRKNERCFLTCKGQGLLAREEHELCLSEKEYRELLLKAEGQVIIKERYRIPFAGYTIELDVFAEPFVPLVMAEVEFSTEEEALAFQLPIWFGEEVTYDPAYTNAALSKRRTGGNSIKPGRYRHFKGNEYELLYEAVHSETQELMVVYRALYGNRGIWVRPASMWNEMVTRDGKTFPRFTWIGDGKENEKISAKKKRI